MLKRIRIQNFKSLQDVTLDLQQVNLFIGPNNSGKSNVLKAITSFGMNAVFAKDIYKKRSDSITIETIYEYDNQAVYFDEFMSPVSAVKVYLEIFQSMNDTNPIPIKNNIIKEYVKYGLSDKYSEAQEGSDVFKDISEFVKVPIFKVEPSRVVYPSDYKKEEDLKNDGSNLLLFIQNLYSEHPFKFEKFEKDFTSVTDEFARIRLPATDDKKMQLMLFDKEGAGYTLDSVSEGVVYFLMLLCLFYQPNPPQLLLLEEPEKGIHPRRIKEIINFIFRLADEKGVQIIMTSHSPIVLDEFADIPESVFIFDKNEQGATQIQNLQRDVIEPEQKRREELGLEPVDYLDALGESWKIGFLGGVPK
jgi:AAA15 family ATPase/GTPase